MAFYMKAYKVEMLQQCLRRHSAHKYTYIILEQDKKSRYYVHTTEERDSTPHIRFAQPTNGLSIEQTSSHRSKKTRGLSEARKLAFQAAKTQRRRQVANGFTQIVPS